MFNATVTGNLQTVSVEDNALVANVLLENGVLLTGVPFLGAGDGFLPPVQGADVLLLYQGNSLPYIVGEVAGGQSPALRSEDEDPATETANYAAGFFTDMVLERKSNRISLSEKGGITLEPSSEQHARVQLGADAFLRIARGENSNEQLLNASEFITPLFSLLESMALEIEALKTALRAGQAGIASGISAIPDPAGLVEFTDAMTNLPVADSTTASVTSTRTSCEAAKNPAIKVPSNA